MPRKKEEKKEERKRNTETVGIAGFTLGVTSIIIFIFYPVVGFLLSVVGFFLCLRQQRREKTRTGRVGMILNIIGFVLSIAMFIVTIFWLSPYLNQVYMQQLNNTLTSP